ncbi:MULTISPECIES: outer membrane protein [Aminobacter]|uniref:31 kDa outer-membrane immunogenic protein n=2 Tax=Aminobacter TaxID=31988 RepID=A0AAC8YRQ2_AMIAI|nr:MULTISPECIES: outer membrane protein [Aminobacter]AMS43167.1 31 kDa outer-membrane immunogenic protein [Aminobacter aminovorans]MBA8905478.1 outer membrane immunogenic protein [Aminobacter ciceronei]MBA9019222.1 outer membrane immunogenic protein [Aminobacter ciceronei]MBB3706286.1 outer membrane immunogenic protein [Aminobacter aminovorans]WMC99013.1 porin family protein [Aminobacter aminovorans]
MNPTIIKSIRKASFVTLFASSLALAASLPAAASDALSAPPAGFVWTGGYAGVHLGYGGDRTTVTELDDYSFSAFGDTQFKFNSNGFLGGVHAGYNWQSGQLVYGVEFDFTGANIDKTVANSMMPMSNESFSTKIDWFSTARVRLGYSIDRFLPFVTGGAALGHIRSSYDDNDPSQNNHAVADEVVGGWTIGAGAQYALTDNWSVRAEYLFVDLNDSQGSLLDGNDRYRYDFDNNIHAVRLGASYRF